MRVPDIANVLAEHGWIKPKNAVAVIRTAMGRRQNLFERVAFGLYALRKWPSSVKRAGLGPSRRLRPKFGPRTGSFRPHQESLPSLAHSTLKRAGKPLHFKEIITILEEDRQEVNKPSLLRGIYRCIEQGRLFYLDSPGTFGLLEWQNETPQETEESGEDSTLFTE